MAETTIPSLSHDWSVRLSFVTNSTVAELATIPLPLQNPLLLGPLGKVLILSDSHVALLQLKNREKGSVFASVASDLCREAEEA